MFVSVCLCGYVPVSVGTGGGQKRALDFLELECLASCNTNVHVGNGTQVLWNSNVCS